MLRRMVKGKGFAVHDLKAYRVSRNVSPLILNPSGGWR
jgi:hypothetical protein